MKTKVKDKKQTKKGKVLSSEEKKKLMLARSCLTPKCRFAFPAVFEPTQFEDQEPKYQVTMLFKKKADLSKLHAAAKAAAKQQWGTALESKLPKGKKGVPFAWPWNDGNEKEDLDGFKGHIYIKASSKRRPGVVDRDKSPITEEDDAFYAGCYGRAALIAFAYGGPGTKYNPGVSFALQHVQKLDDGEPFGGGPSAEDTFDDWDDDSEEGGSEEEE